MTGKILDLLIWSLGISGLVTAAITGSVLVLFTAPVFAWLGFHPIAIEFFGGGIDSAALFIFRRDGLGFSANEVSHLIDVRAILDTVRWVLSACVVVCGLGWVFDHRLFRSACFWAPGVFLAIGGSVIMAYFVFGFQCVGVFLHQTVFPQGNWSFPFSSLIIRLYGTQEMVTGTVFVILTALAMLVLVALGTRLRGRDRGGLKSGE